MCAKCRSVGIGWFGEERCRNDKSPDAPLNSGCVAPPVEPLEQNLDVVAFRVFSECLDQFEWLGDGMSGFDRQGVPLERIKIAAEMLGYELNEALLSRVKFCIAWYRVEFKPAQPKRPESVN